MADNSVLEIALDADNNVWWTIIDAAAFVALLVNKVLECLVRPICIWSSMNQRPGTLNHSLEVFQRYVVRFSANSSR